MGQLDRLPRAAVLAPVARWLPSTALALVAVALLWNCTGGPARSTAAGPAEPARLDPAAWGADHVGQEIPMYMESGECLFCHRDQVGTSWQTNKHNRTIRDADPAEPAMQTLLADPRTKAIAAEVKLLMGDTRAQRFLRRSPAYGKLELLSVEAAFGRGRRARLDHADMPKWDTETFAEKCAGCHTTAYDSEAKAFAAVSLDCYTCHGDAPAEHANDPKLMALAKARKDSPAAVTSICASCHVRFGKSRSTGLPFPNNFVAGDNLFKDFEVDFAQADNEKLNPADRHVMQNVRDVVLYGREQTTCLTCHDVHTGSTKRHFELSFNESCTLCHANNQPVKGHKNYEVHSERCGY